MDQISPPAKWERHPTLPCCPDVSGSVRQDVTLVAWEAEATLQGDSFSPAAGPTGPFRVQHGCDPHPILLPAWPCTEVGCSHLQAAAPSLCMCSLPCSQVPTDSPPALSFPPTQSHHRHVAPPVFLEPHLGDKGSPPLATGYCSPRPHAHLLLASQGPCPAR